MMYTLMQPDTGARRRFRKRYKVAKDLVGHLSSVMERCIHPCLIVPDEEGTYWCYTNEPSGVFHKLVQRARCEQMSDRDGVCYLSRSEYNSTSFKTAFVNFKQDNALRPVVPLPLKTKK